MAAPGPVVRRLFVAFKYLVYAAIAVNTGYFFWENLTASAVTYGGEIAPGEIVIAFSDAIDTAAWLVLLLVLELETAVLPDTVRRSVDIAIGAVSALCLAVIAYAFYGYVGTLWIPSGFAPWEGAPPCDLVGKGFSVALDLDAYEPLTAQNCAPLAGGSVFNERAGAFATAETRALISRLAWTDVVNAGVWIVIVVILELEVYLPSSRLVGAWIFLAYKAFKGLLYLILAVAAAYWLYLGERWEAWDAFLWLAAFFFIEMNLLEWQEEKAATRRRARAF